MALRGDYEGLRGSILHRSPLPSVDSVVSEFLAEEVRLKSHSERKSLSINSNSVLAVPSKPPFNNQNKPYIAVAPDECSFCKSKGHWKAQCPKILKQQNYSYWSYVIRNFLKGKKMWGYVCETSVNPKATDKE